jgi:hypothetical protein
VEEGRGVPPYLNLSVHIKVLVYINLPIEPGFLLPYIKISMEGTWPWALYKDIGVYKGIDGRAFCSTGYIKVLVYINPSVACYCVSWGI